MCAGARIGNGRAIGGGGPSRLWGCVQRTPPAKTCQVRFLTALLFETRYPGHLGKGEFVTARDIQQLLKAKHSQDVYVSECKSGPTYPGYLRLDGWAMKKSWAHPLVTGYEVKISRSDFLQDDKYLGYRQSCNCLFLVAPKDIIMPEEVPEGIGLYTVASTGTRLYMKRKAVMREDPIPEEIYRYILMARVKILEPNELWKYGDPDKEFFVRWLEEKEIDHRLGSHISKALREEIKKKINEVAHKNDALVHENERLFGIKTILERIGLNDIQTWNAESKFKAEYERRINGDRNEIEKSIDAAMKSLEILKASLPAAENEKGE